MTGQPIGAASAAIILNKIQLRAINMKSNLHLHRLFLADRADLDMLARNIKMPGNLYAYDLLFNIVLSRLFGPGRFKPFLQDPQEGSQAVLGYSRMDKDELLQQAKGVAPLEIYNLIDWKATQSKPMPDSWSPGDVMGFHTRICPLVRGPSGHGLDGSPIIKRSPEVDVYLSRCWIESNPPDRETVYKQWLKKEMRRNNAAELEIAQMISFRLRVTLRQGRARQLREITVPDVIFKGELRINNPDAFMQLLNRGLGRHRNFGFGMLLLTASRNIP